MAMRIVFAVICLFFAVRMSQSAYSALRHQRRVSWFTGTPVPLTKKQSYITAAFLIPASLFLYFLAARSFLGY
ncbi:MAG: hypothetical protein Kow0025_08370 [Thermodesulfovibrionales bacterium]